MSIKKNKNQLIISVIVGVAIAVISYQVIVKLKIENENLKKLTQTSASAPIKKITYVVAKTDIKKGDKIQADNLTTKQFPIEIEGAISDTSKIAGFNDNFFVFGDNEYMSYTTIDRKKDHYFDLSDVKRITMHQFRHSHASLLISNNVPLNVIAKRLGDTPDVVLKTYAHLFPEKEAEVLKILNNI